MGNVIKMSEAASLALHAVAIMARKGDELTSVKEIADTLNVSHNHLSKVLQRLVKEGIVVSIKGFHGGFKLAKNPDDIYALEVFEMFDGKFCPSNCLLHKKHCDYNCAMRDFVVSMNDQVKEFLKNTKLSEFFK
jgi:Rrf2 family protein